MAYASYKLVTGPTEPALCMDDVVRHVQVDGVEERERLNTAIAGAEKYAQDYQWSQLITATWEVRLPRFPAGAIELHPNPVSSVTSVSYTDTAGNSQTLVEDTDYEVDTNRKPGQVRPVYNVTWPTARGHVDDVVIRFVAGWGGQDDIPANTRNAMILYAKQFYYGCVETEQINQLLALDSFRVFW